MHSGVTLAPYLGMAIAEEVVFGREHPDRADFRPARFFADIGASVPAGGEPARKRGNEFDDESPPVAAVAAVRIAKATAPRSGAVLLI